MATLLTPQQQAQNLRFAKFVKGTSAADGQHQPATTYPVTAWPHTDSTDFMTGALLYPDHTVLVHIDPEGEWTSDGPCLSCLPATPMLFRLAQDRVQDASLSQKTGALKGIYSMNDLRTEEGGIISRSWQDEPSASAAAEAAAAAVGDADDGWLLVNRQKAAPVLSEYVEGAPTNPWPVRPPPKGYRWIWSHSSTKPTLARGRQSAATAAAQPRSELECAQVWARYMAHHDHEAIPMTSEMADAQRQFANAPHTRTQAAQSVLMRFAKPHMTTLHSTAGGARVSERVTKADNDVADAVGEVLTRTAAESASTFHEFLDFMILPTGPGLWTAMCTAAESIAIPAQYHGDEPGTLQPMSHMLRALSAWRQVGAVQELGPAPRRKRVALSKAMLHGDLRKKSVRRAGVADINTERDIALVPWATQCELLSGPNASTAEGLRIRASMVAIIETEMEMKPTQSLDRIDCELRTAVASRSLDEIIVAMQDVGFNLKACHLLSKRRQSPFALRLRHHEICIELYNEDPDRHANSHLLRALYVARNEDKQNSKKEHTDTNSQGSHGNKGAKAATGHRKGGTTQQQPKGKWLSAATKQSPKPSSRPATKQTQAPKAQLKPAAQPTPPRQAAQPQAAASPKPATSKATPPASSRGNASNGAARTASTAPSANAQSNGNSTTAQQAQGAEASTGATMLAATKKVISDWHMAGGVQLAPDHDAIPADLWMRTLRLEVVTHAGAVELPEQTRRAVNEDGVLEQLFEVGLEEEWLEEYDVERSLGSVTVCITCCTVAQATCLRAMCPTVPAPYSPQCAAYTLRQQNIAQFGEGTVQIVLHTPAGMGVPWATLIRAFWQAVTVNDCHPSTQRGGMPSRHMTQYNEDKLNPWALVAAIPGVKRNKWSIRITKGHPTFVIKVCGGASCDASQFADDNPAMDDHNTPKHVLWMRLHDGRPTPVTCDVTIAPLSARNAAVEVRIVDWDCTVDGAIRLLESVTEREGHAKRNMLMGWESVFLRISSTVEAMKQSSTSHTTPRNREALRAVLASMGVNAPGDMAVPRAWGKLVRLQAEAIIAGILTSADMTETWEYSVASNPKIAEKIASVSRRVAAASSKWSAAVCSAANIEPAPVSVVGTSAVTATAGASGAANATQSAGSKHTKASTPSPARKQAATQANSKAAIEAARVRRVELSEELMLAIGGFQQDNDLSHAPASADDVRALVKTCMQLHLDKSHSPAPGTDQATISATVNEIQDLGDALLQEDVVELARQARTSFVTSLSGVQKASAWLVATTAAPAPRGSPATFPAKALQPPRAGGEGYGAAKARPGSNKRRGVLHAKKSAGVETDASPERAVRFKVADERQKAPSKLQEEEVHTLATPSRMLRGLLPLEQLHAQAGAPMEQQMPPDKCCGAARFGRFADGAGGMTTEFVKTDHEHGAYTHAGVLAVSPPAAKSNDETALREETDSLFYSSSRSVRAGLAAAGSNHMGQPEPSRSERDPKSGRPRSETDVAKLMRADNTRSGKRLKGNLIRLYERQDAAWMLFAHDAVWQRIQQDKRDGGTGPLKMRKCGLPGHNLDCDTLPTRMRQRAQVLRDGGPLANAGTELDLLGMAYLLRASIEVLVASEHDYTTVCVVIYPGARVVCRLACNTDEGDVTALRWQPLVAVQYSTIGYRPKDNTTSWQVVAVPEAPAVPESCPTETEKSPDSGEDANAVVDGQFRGIDLATYTSEYDPHVDRQEYGKDLWTGNDEPASDINPGMVCTPKCVQAVSKEVARGAKGANLVGASDGAAPHAKGENVSPFGTAGCWLAQSGATTFESRPTTLREHEYTPFWTTAQRVFMPTDEDPTHLTTSSDNYYAELVGVVYMAEAAVRLGAAGIDMFTDCRPIATAFRDGKMAAPRCKEWFTRLQAAKVALGRAAGNVDAMRLFYISRDYNTVADALANLPIPALPNTKKKRQTPPPLLDVSDDDSSDSDSDGEDDGDGRAGDGEHGEGDHDHDEGFDMEQSPPRMDRA